MKIGIQGDSKEEILETFKAYIRCRIDENSFLQNNGLDAAVCRDRQTFGSYFSDSKIENLKAVKQAHKEVINLGEVNLPPDCDRLLCDDISYENSCAHKKSLLNTDIWAEQCNFEEKSIFCNEKTRLMWMCTSKLTAQYNSFLSEEDLLVLARDFVVREPLVKEMSDICYPSHEINNNYLASDIVDQLLCCPDWPEGDKQGLMGDLTTNAKEEL